jgi:hypothetical protein
MDELQAAAGTTDVVCGDFNEDAVTRSSTSVGSRSRTS